MELIELFSKPPASLAWSRSADGSRTVGTSSGFVLDIWPDRVEAAALFPPDRPSLAARNGVLFQLLIMAMRPDWRSAAPWLAQQMQLAARSQKTFESPNISRKITFAWNRAKSRATLKVKR